MDAHFWPSVYPAILVGLLIGLGQGGLLRIVLGGFGGTIAGALGLLTLKAAGIDTGFVAAALTIAAGAAGGYILSRLPQWLAAPPNPNLKPPQEGHRK